MANRGRRPRIVRTFLCIAFAGTIISTLAWSQGRKPSDISIELVDPNVFRVCADPHNLPFSNEQSDGFENKLAASFAEKLGKRLAFAWYPQATGFVRNTLGAHRCDVIMGFPQGDDLVQGTNPYYRTAYALVFKPGGDLDGINSLADERLKQKRIGVVAGTPPATYLAANSLLGKTKPYPLMVDTRVEFFGRSDDQRRESGRDRHRSVVGTNGGLLRPAGKSCASGRAAIEGNRWPALGLSYRDGSARRGPELETRTQSANPGEPA